MTLKRFRYTIALIGMAGYWFLLANNLIIDGVDTRLATPLAIGYAVGWFVLCCKLSRWMVDASDNPEVRQCPPDGDPLILQVDVRAATRWTERRASRRVPTTAASADTEKMQP